MAIGKDKVNELTSTLDKYGSTVNAGMVETILKAGTPKKTGVISFENGKTFYSSYLVNPITGEAESSTVFEVKQDKKTGIRYMDDPNTPENENLPLSMEAMESIASQLNEEEKARKDLETYGKKLGMQYSIAESKQEEAIINQIRKRQFKDLDTGEAVFADYDTEAKMPYLYKTKEVPKQSFGDVLLGKDGKPFFGTVQERERIKDYSRIEELGQGFTSPDGVKATDVNTTEGIYNNRLLTIANNLVFEKELKAKSQGEFWSHDEVVQKLRDLDRNAEADELDSLKSKKESTQNSFLGIGSQQTSKPLGKW